MILRLKIFALLSAIIIPSAEMSTGPAHGQSIETMRNYVNQGVVGVMCGRTTASYIYFCEDLANLLNDDVGYSLRIIPMVGGGSVRNVEDIIYLRGVDLALTFADALDFMQDEGIHPNIKQKVDYITPLWEVELHILARPEIRSLADLQGQRVNFSTPSTGTFLTMSNVFDALGIEVSVQSDPETIALERMKRGEIVAISANVAVPWKTAQNVDPAEGFHLLEIPTAQLPEPYRPGRITGEDYPNLVRAGASYQTPATQVVLLAYDWDETNPRCAKVQRFVEAFHANFPDLLQSPFQAKWREVDLDAEVPGLKRWDKDC